MAKQTNGEDTSISAKDMGYAWVGSAAIFGVVAWLAKDTLDKGGFWAIVIGALLFVLGLVATVSFWAFLDALIQRYRPHLMLLAGFLLFALMFALTLSDVVPDLRPLWYGLAFIGFMLAAKSLWRLVKTMFNR